jgi:cytochrome c biogenesis factor
MKKVVIFLVSFIVIYLALQIGSGLVLTALYTPDWEAAWKTGIPLSREAVLHRNITYLSVFMFLIAGTVSYFILRIFRTSADR